MAIRTPEEINKESQSLIFTAGNKQYQLKVIEAELFQINKKLSDLGKEYQVSVDFHSKKPTEFKETSDESRAGKEEVTERI